jgi:hypothetical protein
VGDLDDDGHPDLTAFERKTGIVKALLLDGSGGLTSIGMHVVSWTCLTGCGNWDLIGAADISRDGHTDLVPERSRVPATSTPTATRCRRQRSS